MSKEGLICDFNECKLYLDNPVILPCGFTICQEHIVRQNEDEFECKICNEHHKVPSNGFPLNHKLLNIIESREMFTQIHKQTIESYLKLESYIKEHSTVNFEKLINEYFLDCEKKIESHRKKLVDEINQRSNNFLNQLNEKKIDIISNLNRHFNYDFKNEPNLNEISFWKKQMRQPDFHQSEMNILNQKINQKIKEIQTDLDRLKKQFLMNQTIDFIPIENIAFGELKIKKNELIFSKDFGKLLKTFQGHLDSIRSIQLIPNTNKILTASQDGYIKGWNMDTGQCFLTLDEHKDWVTCLLISSHNQKFISGSYDKTIKIWNLFNFNCISTLKNDSEVGALSILPNNQLACGCKNGLINIWSLQYSNILKSIKAHESDCWIKNFHLRNDSERLISCLADFKIKVWDIKNYQLIRKLSGHTDIILALDNTSDGYLLSGSMDCTIRMWDLNSGDCIKVLDMFESVNCIKFVKENMILISLGKSNEIQVYDMNKNRIINQYVAHKKYVSNMVLLPNGKLLSSSGNGEFKLWNVFEEI